jgi:hypothetical protein
MSGLLFGLIGGSVFVLLGRWMYRNPKKVHPNWMYSNPDHPLLIGSARVFATMAMFFGSFVCILALLTCMAPGALTVIVAMVGAIVASWFLRPQVPEAVTPGESHDMPIPKARKFLSKKGWWVVGSTVVVAIGCFFALVGFIRNSDVCQLAVQQVQSNSTAVERLGIPIREGLFVSGSIATTGPSGHADVSIPVSGPKAKGTLYAVATKSGGEWKFERLRLDTEDGSSPAELLDNSSASPIPQ